MCKFILPYIRTKGRDPRAILCPLTLPASVAFFISLYLSLFIIESNFAAVLVCTLAQATAPTLGPRIETVSTAAAVAATSPASSVASLSTPPPPPPMVSLKIISPV
jgi:hypothetical protein